MNLDSLTQSLADTLGGSLPSLLGALAILLIGWIVAVIVRAAARKVFGALKLNDRIQSLTDSKMNVEGGIASLLYFVILLLALIGFFDALKLESISGSLQSLVDSVMAFIPKLIAGGILLLVAWIVATVLGTVVTKVLGATGLDDKLGSKEGEKSFSKSLGKVAFGFVFLLFLPAVLGALELQGLLVPVQGMLDQILGMLPNILGAAAIGLIGWFLARILRDLVSNLLAATGIDSLGERAGLKGTMTLSGLVGLLVYIFVFVPALVSALNTLQIEAIAAPATEMLGSMMAAIPNIFGAAIILGVAWFISGFVGSVISSLLGGLGFDNVPEKIGMGGMFSGATTLSVFVGKVIVFFVMLFAAVEAAGRLGFGQISDVLTTLLAFGGQVLLGTVIIGAGLWISNLAHRAISGSGNRGAAASIVRFAILGIVFAMGLRSMGLADDIVNLAFGLTLGAIAVAFALSFGLGGREAAGKQMDHWLTKFRS